MKAFRGVPIWRRAAGAMVPGLLLLVNACAHMPFRSSKEAAAREASSMASLQSSALRYADGYVSSVSHACDQAVREDSGARSVQLAALRWKLDQATAAYAYATGDNPVWNTLDLVVFAVVSRMAVEDPKERATFGAAVDLLIATHRELEASAWNLAAGVLKPGQRQELERLIAQWREQNPNERSIGAMHFREFAASMESVTRSGRLNTASVFTLLHIDPFAGLDPTTVAIEQSRELAARAVAYAERAPTLLRWQAELLALQLAGQPEALQILADASRASKSMEQIGLTAEGLPTLVNTQRTEAIEQLLAGVAAERSAILKDLDAREATIRGLLGETRQTLEAGTAMSNSLDATVKSLDAFMHYVSPPPKPGAPPAPAGKPFDVLDYGRTATDVAGMARELQTLLDSIDKSGPALAKVGAETGENLKRVVDHAFWRGLVLILVLLVGSLVAALAYRALARRLFVEASPRV